MWVRGKCRSAAVDDRARTAGVRERRDGRVLGSGDEQSTISGRSGKQKTLEGSACFQMSPSTIVAGGSACEGCGGRKKLAVVVVKSAGSSGGQQIEAAVVDVRCIMRGLVDYITSESGNATMTRPLTGGPATSPTLHQEIPAVAHSPSRGDVGGFDMAVSGSGSLLLIAAHPPRRTAAALPPTPDHAVRCPSSRDKPNLPPSYHTHKPEDGNSTQTMTMT